MARALLFLAVAASALVPPTSLKPGIPLTTAAKHGGVSRGRNVAVRALRLDQPLLKVTRSLVDGPLVLGGAAVVAAAALGAGGLVSAAYDLAGGSGGGGGGGGAGGLGEWAKMRYGTARAVTESVKLAWSDLFEDESVTVLSDTWAPCLLESREDFGEGADGVAAYTAYRFSLKQGAKTALPLELGQEITFVGLDERNRPARASFPLANARREPGYVEIVAPSAARRAYREAVGGCTPEQAAVADAFDVLPLGGEAAVRPGRRAFAYEGEHLPITSLHVFCEELGALPAISLLAESLPRGRSTIERAQVFWINASEDDFGLYESLERLYYKFPKKLELACVVDERLHDPAPAAPKGASKKKASDAIFARNEDLADAVLPWAPGQLAVAAGPPAFQAQVVAHLTQAKGYPLDCVVYF